MLVSLSPYWTVSVCKGAHPLTAPHTALPYSTLLYSTDYYDSTDPPLNNPERPSVPLSPAVFPRLSTGIPYWLDWTPSAPAGRRAEERIIVSEPRRETQVGWSLLQNRSIFLRIPDTSVFRDRAPLSGEARKEQAMMALLRPAY